jgi:predicted nuclease with TOPRIM domain
MSDPNAVDVALETGKSVGSGGGILALGYMLINVFKKKVEVDDEREAKALEGVLAEMKALTAGMSALTGKLDVLTERTSNMRADFDKLEGENKEMSERLARLEGKFDHLSEQLAK